MKCLLHDVFIESVRKNPEKLAVVEENGKSISYEELDILSNRFAHAFGEMKPSVREKPYVGILSTVHIHSIAAVLGTLKIAAAYVPLDDSSPVDRLQAIVESARLDIICVDPVFYEKYRDLFSMSSIEKVILLDFSEIKEDRAISFSELMRFPSDSPGIVSQVADDLAYVLHTSGSTGVPKGIMLTHRNARTFVDWMQKEFQLKAEDVFISRAPFKFDLSIFDLFNCFKAGAKLVCYDWKEKRPLEEKHVSYVRLMEKEKVTVFYTTPSTFIVLMNRGKLDQHKLALRQLMYAGEPFPIPKLRRLLDLFPGMAIANIYGPTETNIITYYKIKGPIDSDDPIPLGHVVDDTEILVVSEDAKRICKDGEIGELWCRGGTVTLGYLGMEEKTKESLIVSPFHSYPCIFWRTGDFGFKDALGLLHYRGRRDHMVKVKGFRIELGEIESALALYPDFEEFCVTAVPDDAYGHRLYCHYSLIKGKDSGEGILREFLSKYLPDYMIPYRFIYHKSLPKTSSGKIDRINLQKTFMKV